MIRSGFKSKTYAQKLTAQKASKERLQQKAKAKPRKVIKTLLRGKKVAKKARCKVKVKTQAQLKKELDTIYSIYIRQKYADSQGNVDCYTCSKQFTIKTIQNGHFVSRQYLATRWSDNNCRPQCWGCNGFGNGRLLDYEERLKKELGSEVVEQMKASRHTIVKLDRNWYTTEITRYKRILETFV